MTSNGSSGVKGMHKHLHLKKDGRELWLYSEEPKTYDITNDLEPLDNAPDPHMRWHPLREEWVLYNAGRNNRTFHPPNGYNPLAPVATDGFPGEIPTPSFELAVFENRWPGLSFGATGQDLGIDIDTPGATGRCDVVVYGSRIDDRLYDLTDARIALLLAVWGDRYTAMRQHDDVAYVLPFESRGEFVGVTLPHPHGQIYSFGFVPPIIDRQAAAERKSGVLSSLIGNSNHRLFHNVASYGSDASAIVVPKFARYPYETWVLPPRAVEHPGELTADERLAMARQLKSAVQALDDLFGTPMPFCMWVSLAPKGYEGDWPFHIQIWPMQRSTGKMKFLASVEQLTQVFLVDVMPEDAAASLRQAIDNRASDK